MTKVLLSFFLLLGQTVFGQSADSINKIILEYSKRPNSWGDPGIYGRAEVIEISKTTRGDFIISRHLKTIASAGNDGKSFHTDTIDLNTRSSKIIKKESIQNWLTQLNTNHENFTVSFIKPKLTKPTKNEIYQVAKKIDEFSELKGNDLDREDKSDAKKAIRDIKHFYGLDSFLRFKRPKLEYDMIVIDNSHRLRIMTIKNTDTTKYLCQFFEPLGQPITRFENSNYMKWSKVFNLEANTSAQRFLPKSSMINKILAIDNIKEEYIEWYLKNIF